MLKENAEMVICDECGKEFPASEAVEIGGDTLCPDCAENFVECYDCGNRVHCDDALKGADGKMYCNECFYDTFCYCERCDNVEYLDDCVAVNVGSYTERWCEACADAYAYKCDDCGKYFAEDHVYTDDCGNVVCSDCYNYGWYTCNDCGRLIRADDVVWHDDTPYCDECHSDDVIHSYHSNIRPLHWHGVPDRRTTLGVGIEAEIDSNHTNYSCYDFEDDAEAIVNAAGYDVDESVVVENDGSLNYGFELISTTASIDYHINNYGWEEMMAKAVELGYTSHDAGTCGLHVHMDRMYFFDAMEDVEYNALVLVINNADWMKKFSRREDFYYCKFPEDIAPFKPADFKPVGGTGRKPIQELLDLRNQCTNHYHALNFLSGSTIEIRFNRGTLNFNTFVATLQFVQMFADAMKHSRLDTCAKIGLKWFKRVAKRRGYTQFLDYLKKRGIEE